MLESSGRMLLSESLNFWLEKSLLTLASFGIFPSYLSFIFFRTKVSLCLFIANFPRFSLADSAFYDFLLVNEPIAYRLFDGVDVLLLLCFLVFCGRGISRLESDWLSLLFEFVSSTSSWRSNLTELSGAKVFLLLLEPVLRIEPFFSGFRCSSNLSAFSLKRVADSCYDLSSSTMDREGSFFKSSLSIAESVYWISFSLLCFFSSRN